MSTAVVPFDQPLPQEIEQVLLGGDLAKLTVPQRLQYYNHLCRSLGLNPLTQPFSYITLNGKLTLYAKKDCTDQLRNVHNISVTIPSRQVIEGVFVVTAQAKRTDGRCDESVGAVPIEGLKGESRANAMMKAETKAKRRVTLSLCGLGMLDESEVSSIPGAEIIPDVPDGGSREAQVAVAERKIKEEQAKLDAQRAEQAGKNSSQGERFSDPPPQPKMFDIAKTVKEFGKLKPLIGDAAYYRILGKYGVTHSNEFREATREDATAAYREMKALAAIVRPASAQPEKPTPPPTPKQKRDNPELADLLTLNIAGEKWGWSNKAIQELGQVFRAWQLPVETCITAIEQGCAPIGGPQVLQRDDSTDDAYRLMLIAKITRQWYRIPEMAAKSSTNMAVLLDAIQLDCTNALEVVTAQEIESCIERFEKGPNL